MDRVFIRSAAFSLCVCLWGDGRRPGRRGYCAVACHPRDRPGYPRHLRPVRRRRRQISHAPSPARLRGVQRAGGPHGRHNDGRCRATGVHVRQRSRKCQPGRGSSGGVPESAGRGGGGGAVPRSTVAGRSSNLPAVPSAPITRNIVIRGAPSGGGPQARPCRSSCRPRCDRDSASSRWPRRPRARRCPKVGLRLPRHRHPRLRP